MDYPQYASWYPHRQSGFLRLAADLGHGRVGTYGMTDPSSYGQLYPFVDSHMVGGFEHDISKPPRFTQDKYWAQMPLSSDYGRNPQERSGRGIYPPTHGGRPWLNPSSIEHSGYFPQPAHWRSRTQHHPRPRSARLRSSSPYMPEHGAPHCWTNVYGLDRHVEPCSGGLPRAQKSMFQPSTMPGANATGNTVLIRTRGK